MRSGSRFLIGLGAGLIIGASLMTLVSSPELSDGEVEKAARDMGMIYPDEVTVMEQLEGEVGE